MVLLFLLTPFVRSLYEGGEERTEGAFWHICISRCGLSHLHAKGGGGVKRDPSRFCSRVPTRSIQ